MLRLWTWKTIAASALVLGGGTAAAAVATMRQDEPTRESKRSSDADVQRWIDKLGSANFEERDDAIDKLRARGKSALDALDRAAESADDAEVRWNARRLARDLREGRTDRSLSKSEKPKRRQEWSSGGGQVFTIPDVNVDMAQVERQMEEVRERLKQMKLAMPKGGTFSWAQNDAAVRIDNDGHVKVTVREKDENGEEKEQSYEASSLDEFREKYPEVAKSHLENLSMGFGATPHFSFGQGGGRTLVIPELRQLAELKGLDQLKALGGLDIDDPMELLQSADQRREALDRVIGEDNGERLGINAAPVTNDLATVLGIEAGEGIVVESVTPGSLAESLGLRAHDVVLSIAGKKLGADATLREALASVKTGESVKVEVLRVEARHSTLEAKKPERKSDAEPRTTTARELQPGEKPRRMGR